VLGGWRAAKTQAPSGERAGSMTAIVKGVKQKGMKNDLGGRRRNLLGRGRLPHPSKRRPRSD